VQNQLTSLIESELLSENETQIKTHRYLKEGSHWCPELDGWYDTDEGAEQNNINHNIISLIEDNW
jgi:hypothetical protein